MHASQFVDLGNTYRHLFFACTILSTVSLSGSKTDPTLRIPTSPAVLHESAPLLCSLQKIDAAVRTKNGNLYVFNGAYFWQLERSGLVSEALRIREKWNTF